MRTLGLAQDGAWRFVATQIEIMPGAGSYASTQPRIVQLLAGLREKMRNAKCFNLSCTAGGCSS